VAVAKIAMIDQHAANAFLAQFFDLLWSFHPADQNADHGQGHPRCKISVTRRYGTSQKRVYMSVSVERHQGTRIFLGRLSRRALLTGHEFRRQMSCDRLSISI
jgi:hypothetical protein